MTTTPRRPPGRYDDPPALPRAVRLALTGVLGLAVLAGLVVAWQRFEDRGTSYTVLGYRVVSDTAVEVRFEVPLATGGTVRCTVQARDRNGAVVGRDVVQVGPQRTSPVRMTHLVATSARAVRGEVAGCSA